MPTWNVQIQFEADDEAAARAILETWQLSDGATVLTVIGHQSLIGGPVAADAQGALALDEPEAAPTG